MHKKPIKRILAYNGEYKKLLIAQTETVVILNSHKNQYKNRKKIKNIVYILLIVLVLLGVLLIVMKLL